MTRKTYKIFYLLLSLLLTGCPMDRAYFIRIKNHTNYTIYAYAEYIFPDTLLSANKPFLLEIQSNKIGNIHGYHVNDDTFSMLEGGRILTFFILNKDSVDSYSWEYIREQNVILKRYEFNWEELEMMGGSINYP